MTKLIASAPPARHPAHHPARNPWPLRLVLALPIVGTILREMDENTVVKMLSLMKADQVGPILGEMPKATDRPGEETMARRAARMSDKLRLIQSAK